MKNKIIFDTISNGIMILDENLNILEWNKWLEIKTEIKKNNILNKNLCDVFTYINKDKILRKIKTSFITNNPTFYNVVPHNYLIKIKNNKVVNEIFNYMQQDITIIPYDLEKKLIRVYIYDKTTYCEINYKLKKLSNIDPLTNLYNRRYFGEVSKKLLNLALRNNQNICIAILDIDFFKKINDTYGHNVGDEVLKLITKNMNKYIRKSDVLARIGGEEFAILLNNTNEENAFLLAEKIRIAIENLNYINNNKEIKTTISLGISQLTQEDYDLDSIIIRADKALYEAKNTGRNKSVIY